MSDPRHNPGHDSAAPETAVPIPPRYWWLKRIGIACGVLLLLLVAMRLYWGYEADHRLQAEIDRIRAAGEPIYPQDFDPPEVPDDDNAALALRRALDAITAPPGVDLGIYDLWADQTILVKRTGDAAAFMAANQPVFDLVRRSRSMTGIDWGVRLRAPTLNAYSALVAVHRDQRMLGKFLYVKVFYDVETGDRIGALESLRDILHVADTVAGTRLFLTSYLISASIGDLAVMAVEVELPRLLAAEGGQVSGAMRQRVRSVIADFLDDTPQRDAIRAGYHCEMTSELDYAGCFPGSHFDLYEGLLWPAPLPTPGTWAMKTLLQPMAKGHAARSLRYYGAVANAAVAPSIASAERMLPRAVERPPGILGTARVLEDLTRNSLETFLRARFRMLARQQLAATALAVRLYELDHGRRPVALSDLVPEYVPAVPLDPFATDEREFAYKPNAKRPILYSVGYDGVDDGGQPQRHRVATGPGLERRDVSVGDIPFYLDGRELRSRQKAVKLHGSTGEADEEQRGVEDRGGNADEDEAGVPEPPGGAGV